MKQFIFSVIILLTGIQSYATIRRVNNTPGLSGANIYQTINQANLASSPGDTIHIEFVGQNDTLIQSITKDHLTIIGNNYYSCQRLGVLGSYCNIISVKIYGDFELYNNSNTLRYCRANDIGIGGDSNQINSCYFSGANGSIGLRMYSSASHNIISNCYTKGIYMSYGPAPNGTNHISHGNTFINNVIDYIGITPPISKHVYSSTLINNIYKGPFLTHDSVNTYLNNVSTSSSVILPTSGGNLSNVDGNLVFADPTSNIDSALHVLPSFPLQNIGIFAGATPFKLTYLPSIPVIFNTVVPTVVNGNSLNIILSTRSNN